MKKHLTKLFAMLLALALIAGAIPVVFAAAAPGEESSQQITGDVQQDSEAQPQESEPVGEVPSEADPSEEEPAGPEVPAEPEEPQYVSSLYVNGVPVPGDSFQNVKGTNYITVQAFIAVMDPEAAVSEWNGTVSVSASSGGADLSMTAGAGNVYLQANGRCLYVAGGNRYVNGLVAVPVRVMATVFNMDVAYDGDARVAFLTPREGAGPYLTSGAAYYNGDDLYWLSHIINAESGNQPLDGKIAVGNVIMNRVNDKSSNWPNTIMGVIFQKNQFSPAASGSVYREPNAQSVIAAKLVLEGVQVLPTAKFFNASYLRNTWAARNRPYITTIGGHAFYA